MATGGEMLQPQTTTLLVIDMQEKLLPPICGREQVIANVQKLLRLADILKIRTVMTTQYSRGLGPTLPEIASLAQEAPVDKVSFGCFGDEKVLRALQPDGSGSAGAAAGPRALLVAGIETHICVMQTVLGALAAGYPVHVASDATGSRSAGNARTGVDRMRAAGAVISSAEMAIYELLGRSDRPEFKQMLPWLK